MTATLSLALLAVGAAPPEPKPLVGSAPPAGVVARLGPDAFRYAGYVGPLEAGGSPVWFSSDGKRVGTTATSGVYLFDAASGKRILYVPSDPDTETGFLGFHGDELVVQRRPRYSAAGVFRVDPASGKVTAKFLPTDARKFFATSPDGKIVYSRCGDNDYTAENVATAVDSGKELWRRKMPSMRWLRVSPDGSRLVVWSSRSQWEVEVLDAATGKTVEQFAHPDVGYPTWTGGGVTVGPKAQRIVGAHAWNRGFTVFESGTEKPIIREPGGWTDNAFLTADAKRAVVTREEKGVHIEVWDVGARKKLSSVAADIRGPRALSPDGTTLAEAGDHRTDRTLRFFDVATGKPRPNSPAPFTQAAIVWYLPDGTLASADTELKKPVRWDLPTGTMTALPERTKPPVAPKLPAGFAPPAGTGATAVAPDGQRVLAYRFDPDELDSSPGDTYLGLFDARGKLVKQYMRPDHTNGASYVFSPDGKTLAVSRGDGTLTFFDAETGAEIGSYRTASGAGALAFSPVGKHLALAGGDTPIVVWAVPFAKK